MAAVILVVDDERGVNDLICDALRLAGHEPVSVRDGSEALQALRETPVDLVILDINMPRIDGFSALARMRESGDNTPVTILPRAKAQTTYAEASNLARTISYASPSASRSWPCESTPSFAAQIQIRFSRKCRSAPSASTDAVDE